MPFSFRFCFLLFPIFYACFVLHLDIALRRYLNRCWLFYSFMSLKENGREIIRYLLDFQMKQVIARQGKMLAADNSRKRLGSYSLEFIQNVRMSTLNQVQWNFWLNPHCKISVSITDLSFSSIDWPEVGCPLFPMRHTFPQTVPVICRSRRKRPNRVS